MSHTVFYLDHSSDFSGGQKSLLALLTVLDREKFSPVVVIDRKAVKMQNELKRLNVPFIAINFFNVKKLEYFFFPFVLLNIWLKIITRNVSILHCNTFKAGLIGALLSYVVSKPIVFRARLGIILLSHGVIDKIIFKGSNLVLANSHYVKETFTERFGAGEKVQAVYNPLVTSITLRSSIVEDFRTNYFSDHNTFYFGVIGRIEPFKRLHEVIEAAAQIPKDLLFKVLIIGDRSIADGEEYFHQLQSLITKYNLESNIQFTGFISEIHEITSLLNCAILSSEGEALSRGLYEAQFLNVPVIATKSGGNPEIVSDETTGLLYEPGRADLLAAKMIYAIRNPDKMKVIANTAKSNVITLFNDQHTVRKEESMLLELLKDKQAFTRTQRLSS